FEVKGDSPDDLRKGERRDRQVVSTKTHGGKRDESGSQAGHRHSEQGPNGKRELEAAEMSRVSGARRCRGGYRDCRRVGSDEKEACDAWNEEPGVSPLEVEAQSEDREDNGDANIEPEIDEYPRVDRHCLSLRSRPREARLALVVSLRLSQSSQ